MEQFFWPQEQDFLPKASRKFHSLPFEVHIHGVVYNHLPMCQAQRIQEEQDGENQNWLIHFRERHPLWGNGLDKPTVESL